ncbi:hypothetical protein BC834DRAFT_844005 [Gloeopeniophorella convolvens]|nr:hypothetical protein BC834DRAFT_844005 [Gloeopeniophorella convolvens]
MMGGTPYEPQTRLRGITHSTRTTLKPKSQLGACCVPKRWRRELCCAEADIIGIIGPLTSRTAERAPNSTRLGSAQAFPTDRPAGLRARGLQDDMSGGDTRTQRHAGTPKLPRAGTRAESSCPWLARLGAARPSLGDLIQSDLPGAQRSTRAGARGTVLCTLLSILTALRRCWTLCPAPDTRPTPGRAHGDTQSRLQQSRLQPNAESANGAGGSYGHATGALAGPAGEEFEGSLLPGRSERATLMGVAAPSQVEQGADRSEAPMWGRLASMGANREKKVYK